MTMRWRAPEAEGLRAMRRTEPWTSRCPECDSDELLFIGLLIGGSTYRFSCCHPCETKWWEREGMTVPLGAVLSFAAGR